MTTTASGTTQGAQGKGAKRSLSRELPITTLTAWLRDLMLIREFEVRTMQAYSNAQIGGFCHIYIGQEAVAVGTINAVNKDDPVITAYRDHGHALARGMDPRACMAEMYGKITGCAKGKGGSMHMFDKPHWLFGGHGIVGAQTPVGAGLAFGAMYDHNVRKKGPKKVCLCYLGDGALNQGAFHEAMNLAGILSIPVIYVLENNMYSMGTSIERGTTMAHDLRKKADAYGIESRQIDGMNVLNVYDAFKPLADACRDEERPAFVDLKTYRYHGHSMSDPQKYRTKDEVNEFKESDPVDSLAKHLVEERNSLSEDDYKAIQKDVRKVVRDAVKFAEESPFPDVEEELYSDVYTNPQPPFHHGAPNPMTGETLGEEK